MRLWASKHGGTTFTVGVNALSVNRGVKKITQVVRLARLRLVWCKKVPNSEGGSLRVYTRALRQWQNFGTGQKWSETRGGPLIEVVRT